MRPRKDLKRKVYGRCIQRIDGIFQINAEGVIRIKTPRFHNKSVGKIAINPPVALLVRVGEIAPRDVPANAKMIKFGFLRAQTDLDVAQTFAERQLCERHAQKLIQM